MARRACAAPDGPGLRQPRSIKMETLKRFSAEMTVGWAKTPVDAQKSMNRFEAAIARAVVELGNEGVDPAVMGTVLTNAAAAVAAHGFAPLLDALKDIPEEDRGPIPPV